ncbi:hypothetical protein CBL_06162 [Carabus blaptoides fortunei]
MAGRYAKGNMDAKHRRRVQMGSGRGNVSPHFVLARTQHPAKELCQFISLQKMFPLGANAEHQFSTNAFRTRFVGGKATGDMFVLRYSRRICHIYMRSQTE